MGLTIGGGSVDADGRSVVTLPIMVINSSFFSIRVSVSVVNVVPVPITASVMNPFPISVT